MLRGASLNKSELKIFLSPDVYQLAGCSLVVNSEYIDNIRTLSVRHVELDCLNIACFDKAAVHSSHFLTHHVVQFQ